jgi:predicted RNA binding protein YcfA (HicA-like mRNA interferase family)
MTGKELVKRLKSNGWTLDRIKGSHHIMVKAEKTLSVPIHGNKDIPSGLLSRLLKDGGLK